MCKIAGVSRSGFYAFIKAKLKREDKNIQDALDFTFIKSAYEYKSWKKGARQIRYRLKKDFGIDLDDPEQLKRYIDMRVDLLLGD